MEEYQALVDRKHELLDEVNEKQQQADNLKDEIAALDAEYYEVSEQIMALRDEVLSASGG